MSTKRRRLASPVVVAGAVAAVAAGSAGAWVVFANGNGTVAPDSSAVSQDTAGLRTNPQTGDTGRRVTGGRQTLANRDTSTRPAGPVVNAAGAADALDALLDIVDARPQFARDSAMVLFNAASVFATDKAMAAFVVANSFWKQGDRPNGCQWINRARTLDPATPTFTTVAREQCQ